MRARFLPPAILSCAALALSLLVPLPGAQAAPGPAWHIADLISEPTGLTGLNSIAALSSKDAWVGGQNGTGPIIERWDGQAWRDMTPPRRLWGPPYSLISHVGLSSATNVWALGTSGVIGYALHWNGARWAKFSFHRYLVTSGLAVFSAANVWVFGATGDYHPYLTRYNGRAWHRMSIPAVPFAASPVSADDIWVVGPTAASYLVSPGGFYRSVVTNWTGRSWRSVPLPGLSLPKTQYLAPSNILALSRSNVWVDAEVMKDIVPVRSVLLHWDGRKWRSLRSPVGGLYAMAADGQGGLWLTSNTNNPQNGYLLHLSGTTWSVTPAPLPQPLQPGEFADTGGLARPAGGSSIWASGTLTTAADGGADGIIYGYGP